MNNLTYLRYEILRNLRNWRFSVAAVGFPLVLYLFVAEANRHGNFYGISFPLYFMVAMATLGTMMGVMASASVIAAERASGWTRQMRITPLPAAVYFAAKVINSYLRALVTIALLSLAGTLLLGVRLSVHAWPTVIGLLLAGLIPFTIGGILLGHVVGSDLSAPATAGIVTLFALLGGVYGFQIASSGAMLQFTKALPSYWLVQADKTAAGGGSWPAQGWIVTAAWTVILVLIAVLVYRRDTSRT